MNEWDKLWDLVFDAEMSTHMYSIKAEGDKLQERAEFWEECYSEMSDDRDKVLHKLEAIRDMCYEGKIILLCEEVKEIIDGE